MRIQTVVSILLIFAGLSVPFVNVLAYDGSYGLFVPISGKRSPLTPSHHEDLNGDNGDQKASSNSRYNVINAACSPGSIITTQGTDEPDIMQGCNSEDIMYGFSGNDVLQGRDVNDKLFGGDGNDNLQGGIGGDQLYGENGDDVLFGGVDDDYLVGGNGNDALYGEAGNDVLQGGPGADYFDCGDGLDMIIDFNAGQGDTHSNNCEDIRTSL